MTNKKAGKKYRMEKAMELNDLFGYTNDNGEIVESRKGKAYTYKFFDMCVTEIQVENKFITERDKAFA